MTESCWGAPSPFFSCPPRPLTSNLVFLKIIGLVVSKPTTPGPRGAPGRWVWWKPAALSCLLTRSYLAQHPRIPPWSSLSPPRKSFLELPDSSPFKHRPEETFTSFLLFTVQRERNEVVQFKQWWFQIVPVMEISNNNRKSLGAEQNATSVNIYWPDIFCNCLQWSTTLAVFKLCSLPLANGVMILRRAHFYN